MLMREDILIVQDVKSGPGSLSFLQGLPDSGPQGISNSNLGVLKGGPDYNWP